ncbi:MAG: citramalate synthase [Deltaproteobacteria bacterium]|nr:citramalate synthase [Deltaproteobacteria bacterium]
MSAAPDPVEIHDTTLRDGTQREGISLSSADKLRIAERLDALGVHVIEAGFPGSNPKDAEVFRRARDVQWKQAQLAAFGSTRRSDIHVEHDPGLRTLLEADTPACVIFGKSSAMQVQVVLRTSLDENLRMIEESVAYLRAQGRRVIYDAEHYFDAFAADEGYALETLRAAVRGGADVVVLCDTNGGSLPWQIERAVHEAARVVPVRLGIHAHDDSGCGVANSLAAVRAGARHVQGTINGYGERCGNADLCSVLPGVELKLGLRALEPGKLAELRDVSRFVAEIANLAHDPHQPYVGRSAFAHKGGTHVAAVRLSPETYQHVDPALVGNETRVVVSELSGRANVRSKAEELGLSLEGDLGRDIDREVVREIKDREAEGASFEAAEASVALMLQRRRPGYRPPFRVLAFQVITSKRDSGSSTSEATIKLEIGGAVVHTAAEGGGPVAALDAALRKALTSAHPLAAQIHLVDYKVRILDGRDGTAAVTRVLVDSTSKGVGGTRGWSTVGAAPSIVDASFAALADGYEYGLSSLEEGRLEEAQASHSSEEAAEAKREVA